MRVLTLSGWWMSPDALRPCLPKSWQVKELDYLSLPDIESVRERLLGTEWDAIVGWSLGGQLAAHALWQGWTKTPRLVLIGSAYQFVQANGFHHAMAPNAFHRFVHDFSVETYKVQGLFQRLMLKGIQAEQEDIFWHNGSPSMGYWLMQLAYLPVWGRHGLPETLVIHGMKDAVVPVEQTAYWQTAISQCTIAKLRDWGHTVPLHAPDLVRRKIKAFCQK